MSCSKLFVGPFKASLPHEIAFNLSTMCFLKISQCEFDLKEVANVETMSPNGLLPLLAVDTNIIAGFEPIVNSVKVLKSQASNENCTDSVNLKDANKRNIHFQWMQDTLQNIFIYFTWFSGNSYVSVAKPLSGHFLSWPLNAILPYKKWRKMMKYFISIGWNKKTEDDIINDFEGICFAIVQLLGNGPYLYESNNPCEMDALIYGHLIIILHLGKIFKILQPILKKFQPLVNLISRLENDCEDSFSSEIIKDLEKVYCISLSEDTHDKADCPEYLYKASGRSFGLSASSSSKEYQESFHIERSEMLLKKSRASSSKSSLE